MPGLHREDLRGTPRTLLDQTITPVARVVQLTWPGGRLEWHRPVAVEVARGDRVQRIPIRNATRRLVAGIVLAELALGGLVWWALQRSVYRRATR